MGFSRAVGSRRLASPIGCMDGQTPRKIGAVTRSRRDVSSSIVNTKMWAHGPLAKEKTTCWVVPPPSNSGNDGL